MISIFPLLPSRAVDTIFSPDGRIILNCDLRVHEAPYPSGLQFYFNVQFNSFTVIKDSPLGLSLEGRPPLLGDWRLYDQQVRTHTESFRDCFGKRKLVTITWKEAVFSLQEKRPPFRLLKVHFRVSNDGIAFRYEIPAQQIDLPLRLTAEETQIFLPRDYTSYALRRSSFTSTYQRQYTVGQISKWIPDSLVALPLLMQDGENHWLAFAEAELRDCGGLNLLPGNEYGEISLHAALAPLPGHSHRGPGGRVIGI